MTEDNFQSLEKFEIISSLSFIDTIFEDKESIATLGFDVYTVS